MSASNINNTLVSEIAEAAEALEVAQSEVLKPKKSKLKSTPVIELSEEEKAEALNFQRQINVNNNLHQIAELSKLMRQHKSTEFTLGNLKEFKFDIDREDAPYNNCSIEIRDSNRKEFKTNNPRLIQTLVFALEKILNEKLEEIEESIIKVRIL